MFMVVVALGTQIGSTSRLSNELPQAISQKENLSLKSPLLILTIVYDNYSFASELKTAWGFSCLVEGMEKTILFDTGGDGKILLSNMQKLGITPGKIDIVVLSHIHGDHTGGLSSFLTSNPRVSVYLPQSFPESFKKAIREVGAEVIEVKEPLKICDNVYSTGEMGMWIKEESLIIKTATGLVVITGCAHPGIVKIVKKAKEIAEDKVYLVLGGFHLMGATRGRINRIIQEFREEKVKKVAPCHCSGDLTRKLFQEAYKKDFILAGVGKKIKIDSE